MNVVRFNTQHDVRPSAFQTIHGDWQPTVSVISDTMRPLCIAQRVGAFGMHRRTSKWDALRAACRLAREMRSQIRAEQA
jgi:hypothetical protein